MDDLLAEIKAFGARIKPTAGSTPGAYDSLFDQIGKEEGVDPDLLRAMTRQESSFNPRAVSPKNAQGLMQLIPATAERFGVKDVFDPKQNIRGGAKYVKFLMDRFDGDLDKVLAGYNAGEGAVDKYGGIPPYKETQNYVKSIRSKYKPGEAVPKAGVDFSKVREILGITEEAAPEAVSPNFSKVKAILDDATDTVEKVSTEGTSSPKLQPPATKTKQTVAPPVAPQATAPVAQEFTSNTDVDMNDPWVKHALAEQRAEINDPTLSAEERQALLRANGVATGSTPRVRGIPTDNLNTVAGSYTPVSYKDDADAALQAINYSLSKYGVTPEEASAFVEKHRGDQFREGSYQAGKPIEVPFSILAEIKGKDYATGEIRMEQAQARPNVEELPPSSIMTKDLYERLATQNPLIALAEQDPVLNDLAKRVTGMDTNQLLGKTQANLDAGFAAAGGRTSRFAAGLMRLLDPAVIAGLEDAPDGTQRKLRAYGGQDIYPWMQSLAKQSEKNAADLNDGLYAEIFQMAGGLPSDLSRIMLASSVLPGGIVTATSLDMAAQSAGRGENWDQVVREGQKGAVLGGLARVLTPLTRAGANLAGKPAGVIGGLGTVAGGTYVTSRAFGADNQTAIKETLFNTVLSVVDAGMSVKGRTFRVRSKDGEALAVRFDESGDALIVDLKPGENADFEILDNNEPVVIRPVEGRAGQIDPVAYERQSTAAKDYIDDYLLNRDVNETIVGSESRHDGDGRVEVNAQGNILFSQAVNRAFGKAFSYSGLYFRTNQVVKLLDGLHEMHIDYLDEGKTAQARAVAKAMEQVRAAQDSSQFGDLVLHTDLEGIAPDIQRYTLQEENTHRNNYRSNLRELLKQTELGPAGQHIQTAKLGEGYADESPVVQKDEVIAQSFRDDAELRLDATKKETRGARRELYDILDKGGLDPLDYAASMKDISRKGKAFDRYANWRAKNKKSTDPIEVGDFVTSKSDPHSKPYIIHEIRGDNAVVVDAYMADENATHFIPLSELEMHTKLAEPKREAGDVDYVDMYDPDSADANSLLDMSDNELETFLKGGKEDGPQAALLDRFRRKKEELEDFKRPVSLFDTPGPKGGEVAEARIFDEYVQKAKDEARVTLEGRGQFATEVVNQFIDQFFDPKVKESGLVRSLTPDQQDQVRLVLDPLYTTRARMYEAMRLERGRQYDEQRWINSDYQSQFKTLGQVDPYSPGTAELQAVEGPQAARLHHGSRHRFAPEILVRHKDGREEYIQGKAEDFPEGSTVSRRGDKIIVRYPGGKGRRNPEYKGQNLNEMVNDLVDQVRMGSKSRDEAIEISTRYKAFDYIRSAFHKHPAAEKALEAAKNRAREDAALYAEHGNTNEEVIEALALLDQIDPKDFEVKKVDNRELYSTKEFLPEVPEGATVLKEFPLGRKRDDKLLSGEGAMVRGAGHYEAEARGVAKHYRKAGGFDEDGIEVTYKGQAVNLNAKDVISDVAGSFEGGAYRSSYTFEEAIKDVREMYNFYLDPENADLGNQVGISPDVARTRLIELNSLDPKDFDFNDVPASRGYLYKTKTNIPDEQMLNLDEPVYQQSETVREVVDNLYRKVIGTDFMDHSDPIAPHMRKRGEQVYEDLKLETKWNSNVIDEAKEASNYLHQQGIKGLKFLDADSRHSTQYQVPIVKYKGQDALVTNMKLADSSLERFALKAVANQIQGGKLDVPTAIDAAIAGFDRTSAFISGGDYPKMVEFLRGIDPNDFTFTKPKVTYNHIIFKGEDVDIVGIQFALLDTLKKSGIRDKAEQSEIADNVEKEFPALAKAYNSEGPQGALFSRPKDAVAPPVDPAPAAEDKFNNNRGLPQEGFIKKSKDAVVGFYHGFKRIYQELDPNKDEAHARVNDAFRRLSVLGHWSKVKAQDLVASITNDLGPNNYETFKRITILRDMQKEAEVRDAAGLPFEKDTGYADKAELDASLAHYEAIAAKEPQVQNALDLRDKKIREVTEAMVKIGQLPDSVLEDPRYYHRQVLSAIDNAYGSTGSQDVRLHRKGFQQQRAGDKGEYNYNYLESEAEWLSQAFHQLGKYDLQQEIGDAINSAPALKRDAKLRGIADWTTLIDKKTHTLWQPAEGNYFFKTETIPSDVMIDLLSGVLNVKSLPSNLQDVLALGRRKPEWVVPKEIAKLLDRFQPTRPDNALEHIMAELNGTWKQWTLLNPKSVIGYNLRNMVSDLDVVAAKYPGIATRVPEAINILRKYAKDKDGPEAELVHQLIADGVIDSGQTFAEIPDINSLKVFRSLANTKGIGNPLRKWWEASRNSTNFRENVLRIAAYNHLKGKIDAGENIYGGSTKGQVDAITDPRLKAAKVAREFMGDYGGISENGRWLRSHLLPFYSWMEINAPRYMRMLRNIPAEGNDFKWKPALAAKGVKAAANLPKTTVQMAGMTGAFILWNNLVHPEHEEKLKRTDVGRQPHVILGTREDGTPMVIHLETGLSDALGWLNLGDMDADYNDLKTGKSTLGDKAAEAGKSLLADKWVNALGPQVKLWAELVFGETTYPSIFKKGASLELSTRPMRDRWEYAARTLAVDSIYKKITGQPAPPSESLTPGGVGRTLLDKTITSRVDADEAVYWNVTSDVRKFAEKIGKNSSSADPTDKSTALFFYKKALKWGDEAAARRYLDKYTEIAKKEGKSEAEIKEGINKSMTKAHPLGGLDSEKWGEYIRSANPESRNQLVLAMQFYRDTYQQKDSVGDNETGASVEEVYRMVFPKPVRLIAENSTTISMAVDIYENSGLPAEEQARVKNAIMLRAVGKVKNKSLTMEDQAALQRIGIKLVGDADVQMLLKAGEQQKQTQELKKAAKFGFN